MIYDISPPNDPSLAVFPGDTPLTREVLLDMRRGDPITLSTLRATAHLGAHVDAPSHYSATGATIDQRGLDLFVGPCQVIRVAVAQRGVVAPEAIRAEMTEPRVLMATGTYSNPREFSADFAALSPKLIGWLRRQGVLLVGVDTPSVDPAASKDLPAHRACLEHDVTILEGIVLDHVPEGRYELIALPLRLVGFDASPVRAVLRTL